MGLDPSCLRLPRVLCCEKTKVNADKQATSKPKATTLPDPPSLDTEPHP
jgi:hypothetical protein